MQTECTHKNYYTIIDCFTTILPSSINMSSFLFNPAVRPLPKDSLAVGRSSYDVEQHRIIHSSY
jgi:hypothetical protein